MIYKKTWKPILRHNPPTKLEDMKANPKTWLMFLVNCNHNIQANVEANPKTSNGTAWKIGKQLID